jgi:hypothetical protein
MTLHRVERPSMSLQKIFTATIILGLLGPALASASTHPVERRDDYVAGFAGDTDGLCAKDNPAEVNIGVVCLSVPNRASVSIRIEDASLLPVAGYYVFVNASGAALGSAVSFCGNTTHSGNVPGTASSLIVYIGGPALGPLACLVDTDGGAPGIGTVGDVIATYSG